MFLLGKNVLIMSVVSSCFNERCCVEIDKKKFSKFNRD